MVKKELRSDKDSQSSQHALLVFDNKHNNVCFLCLNNL